MNQSYRQSLSYLLPTLMVDVCLMFIVIGFFTFIKHVLEYLKSEIILGSNGVILKRGFLGTKATEIPYGKINSISVNKGLLGSIFGYGDVLILTGNDVSGIPFKGVTKPDEIKETINKYLGVNDGHTVVIQNSQKYDDLEQLAKLKEKGVITEEEFAQKKKQVLGI